MSQRWPSAAALIVLSLGSSVLLRGAQEAAPTTRTGEVVRLERDEAARLATDARGKVKVELADGLELSLWAPEKLLIDPVAIDLDAEGTMYVTSTTRNNMPLDIRQHQDWMATVHTLRTMADLRAFYKKVMAPANSEKNRWITDLNKDGSRDIRDLVEMKERLYRIRDTDGDGRADESRIVYEGFNEDPAFDILGGVLSQGKDVVVGVPPGVYRLRDTDGDGVFDQRTTIAEGLNTHPAFGGHGVSGVIVGPDGRLYWEVGDIGLHVVDKAGKAWSLPNQGAVLRSEMDGSNFEIFASGIRNLQEFSFDDRGNLISVDNDGDHQGEAERLVYLPYGSDSGWRSNWQYGKYTDARNNRYNVWMREQYFKPRHDGQASHLLAPIENWHSGPSGMAYNPGTALSDAWKNYFFVSSFPGAAPNARVYGFTLKPDGAGFKKDVEKQVTRGVLVVGMRIGPDGALYLTDWITGWDSKNNGRLWKLDTAAASSHPLRADVQALLREDLTKRTPDAVATLLRHADMRVRQKAQFDLVRRGDAAALLAAARDGGNLHGRLHGLWGVAQLARRQPQHAAALASFLTDADAEIRAQAARLIGDVRHQASAAAVLPLLKDGEPRVRFFAAEAMGRLAYKAATPALVAMLADNDGRDMYLQHTGAGALASIGDAAALGQLSTHASRGVRLAAVVALRRMHHAGVARFLSDSDPLVVTDAARAINDEGGIPAALPQLAALLGTSPVTTEPFVRRALNANVRVGTADAVARIEAFATASGTTPELRVEAIAALGIWGDPSPMDRVDGFYHDRVTVPAARTADAVVGAPTSGPALVLASSQGQTTPRAGQPAAPPARRAARPAAAPRQTAAARAAIERLVAAQSSSATPDVDVKVALAEAAGRLEARGAAETLQAQLKSDPSVLVRTAALRGLQAMKAGDMSALMQTALADKDATVRRAALALLPSLPLPPAAKAEHLAAVVKSGGLAEQQGALEVLGTLKTTESRALLGTLVDDLEAGRIAPTLQIDLVDAVQIDGSPALARRLEAYQGKQQADALIKAFRAAALTGGDARKGQQVLTQNPLAECTRCHAIRGRGADVGPELTKIGATLTREQLFEALVDPNKRIAPGFGTVGITLKSGDRVDGTLREETDTEVVVGVGTPMTVRRIAKTEIAERTDPISAMPPLGLVLTPREVRDLIEFLSALR
ncbi:MAG TPA: HEAT repeat domain-containing protein [Luteitalea sp.]|nr:HEAT repeat domain-containing protein [Luteitalea sp.]